MAKNSLPTSLDYKQLFELIPGLYLILAPDLTIMAVSDSCLRATMTERDKIVGLNIFQVFPDNPNNPNATGTHNLKLSLLKVLATRKEDTMPIVQYDIRKPNSEEFEERYWSPFNTPVLDEKGDIIYIIHRAEDVTDFIKLKRQKHDQIKENEELSNLMESMESEVYIRAREISDTNRRLEKVNEKLAQMYKKSEEIDRIKTNFFANVSHELRTPLTLILGPIIKLLASPVFSGEDRYALEIIERNAQLLLKQVTDLLDISKLDAGKVVIQYTQIDLARLVREVTSSFEFFAKEKDINFIVNVPSSFYAEVDIAKLQRIILNLLSNAFKFTPENGRIEVRLEKMEDEIVFSVSDTGPGIPEAMRKAIFDRFYQLEENNSHGVIGGTGIGLTIVKEFVSLHNGNIEVTEGPYGGALFKMMFPIKAPPGNKVTKDYAKEESKLFQSFIPELRNYALGKKETQVSGVKHCALVLIVEDNVDMRVFLTGILSPNYRVETASNGKEGLKKALQQLPDLIISDVMMPEMRGDEMAHALLAHTETKDIPLLLLTAKIDNTLKMELLKEGVQDYITKPFLPEELCIKVAKLISERKKILAEREHLIHELTISNQELERFAYVAAHDLKSPLRAIYNLSQWIEEDLVGLMPDKCKEHMNRLHAQVRLMEKFLDDVLEYSSIEHKLEQNCQIIDGPSFINNIVALLSPPKGFTIKVGDNFKSIWVNQVPLQQVIHNLIHNAIKHHDKETGIIEVNLIEDETQYIFEIRDDGPGIAKEYHQKIFDMFRTLKPRLQGGGTGMGLALVKKIVTSYGGEIMVESQLGQGSTFRFTWQKLLESKE